MPLYDYYCEHCDTLHTDKIYTADRKPKTIKCTCGKRAKSIISCGNSAYLGNVDASWVKSVTDMVDRYGGQHCQDFLRNPTSKRYMRRWMEKEGIRHREPGEKISGRKEPPRSVSFDEVWNRHRKRTEVSIG